MSDTQSPLMKTSRRTFVILLVVAIVAYVTIITGFKHLKTTSTDSDKRPTPRLFIDGLPNRQDRLSNAYLQPTKTIKPIKTVNVKQNSIRKRPIAVQERKDPNRNKTNETPVLIEMFRYIVGDIHNVSVDEINSSNVISYAKIVVVIAYMRSGSTLVGKLIQQHTNTFYLFEPIKPIFDTFKVRHGEEPILTYLGGENRRYHFSDKTKLVLQEIINWLSCQLDLLSIESLTSVFHKTFSPQMSEFYRCGMEFSPTDQKRQPGLTSYYTSNLLHLYACLKETLPTCRNSSLMAMKLIRLRMRDLEPLLPLFPNMKIIHLNRDPRGIFNSRKLLRRRTSVKEFVKYHCDNMSDDLSASKSILLKYPDRLRIIEYENLAETPVLTAKEIYEFIGIEFTNTVRSFVQNTTASQYDTCKFCTERKNSAETASKWRRYMANKRGFSTVRVIQTQCKDSNRVLGYLPFTSTELLRNIEIPSRKRINVTKTLLGDKHF